jgi:hypothetical protein
MSATYTSFCLNYINIINEYQRNMTSFIRTLNSMNNNLYNNIDNRNNASMNNNSNRNNNSNTYNRSTNQIPRSIWTIPIYRRQTISTPLQRPINPQQPYSNNPQQQQNTQNTQRENNDYNYLLDSLVNPILNIFEPFSPISTINQNARLTQQQINSNTTRAFYRDISSNETICPITLIHFSENDEVLQINNCRHIFMRGPLLRWFNNSSLCPVCRYDILGNHQPPVSQQQMNSYNNNDSNENSNGTSTINSNINTLFSNETNYNLDNIFNNESGWTRHGDIYSNLYTNPITTTHTTNHNTIQTENTNNNERNENIEPVSSNSSIVSNDDF